jgi:hypothetical protein
VHELVDQFQKYNVQSDRNVLADVMCTPQYMGVGVILLCKLQYETESALVIRTRNAVTSANRM